MLDTIRRYWIALLVMVMIGLHASIVGLIRYQASMAKIDASCEVDLGNYLAFQSGRKAPISMRLFAIVPINHRMKSRQLIELNQAQIRQSVEEHLRQIDGRVLTDPYLSDLKSQLLDVMVQTIGNSSIDDLVITEVHEPKDAANLEFVSRGAPREPRQLVATLRAQLGDENAEASEGDEAHSGDTHAADDAHSSSDEHDDMDSHSSSSSHGGTKEHASTKTTPAKAPAHGSTSHGTTSKSTSGHGASSHGASTPKKAASSGAHGSTSAHGSTAKKPAKSGGH